MQTYRQRIAPAADKAPPPGYILYGRRHLVSAYDVGSTFKLVFRLLDLKCPKMPR
jgi:hypothetical protein